MITSDKKIPYNSNRAVLSNYEIITLTFSTITDRDHSTTTLTINFILSYGLQVDCHVTFISLSHVSVLSSAVTAIEIMSKSNKNSV
jgi:hypothetical protein